MDNPPHCLRCKTAMERGFTMDKNYQQVLVARWVKGKPEASAWTGTRVLGKETREEMTFRCPACGYLESYAIDIKPAEDGTAPASD
jgi:hypothetical protein